MAENKQNNSVEYYCAHLLLPQIDILRNTAKEGYGNILRYLEILYPRRN